MAASSAPWKQLLLNALEANAKLQNSSFFQLATIGSNGRPSNRTVVFRGFQEDTDKIQINTDCRSRKIDDIKHCPFGEFRINGRIDMIDGSELNPALLQFRINGRIDMIDGSELNPALLQQRERAWFASSLKSRLQYLGPSPGLPCISEEPFKKYPLDPSVGPVETFCLLVFDPEQVDYVNLKHHERLLFSSKQSDDGIRCWMLEKINL